MNRVKGEGVPDFVLLEQINVIFFSFFFRNKKISFFLKNKCLMI